MLEIDWTPWCQQTWPLWGQACCQPPFPERWAGPTDFRETSCFRFGSPKRWWTWWWVEKGQEIQEEQDQIDRDPEQFWQWSLCQQVESLYDLRHWIPLQAGLKLKLFSLVVLSRMHRADVTSNRSSQSNKNEQWTLTTLRSQEGNKNSSANNNNSNNNNNNKRYIRTITTNSSNRTATPKIAHGTVRLESAADGGTKTLVPIRPIACTSGILDLGESILRLVWTWSTWVADFETCWFWEINFWGLGLRGIMSAHSTLWVQMSAHGWVKSYDWNQKVETFGTCFKRSSCGHSRDLDVCATTRFEHTNLGKASKCFKQVWMMPADAC